MQFSKEQILAVIPLVAIHLGLMVYSLKIISKSVKTRILSRAVWIILIIFLNIFGSLAFLLVGRTYETD